jgi:hypothetical protein
LRASTTWYLLYSLFLIPVSFCLTRSIISRLSSSLKHLAVKGLSGRKILMKNDQTHVAKPSIRNNSCQFLMGPSWK